MTIKPQFIVAGFVLAGGLAGQSGRCRYDASAGPGGYGISSRRRRRPMMHLPVLMSVRSLAQDDARRRHRRGAAGVKMKLGTTRS